MGGKAISDVHNKTVMDLSTSDNDVWVEYAQALLDASSVEDVTSALHHTLIRLGYPVTACRVVREVPSSAVWAAPVVDERWFLVVESSDVTLLLHEQPYMDLARSALRRLLLEEERRQRFLEALDTLSSVARTDDILAVLAQTLSALFSLPHVRVFRYMPKQGGLELVALADVVPTRLESGQVFAPEALPSLWKTLEEGTAVAVPLHAEDEWVQEGVFPATVPYVGIVPFWISTREMGAVVVALSRADDRVWERPFFQALLHHTAVAVERTEVFQELALARQEADLLLDKTFTAIVLLSPDYRVKRVNPAAAELLNVRPEQMLARPVTELMGREILRLLQQEDRQEVQEWTVVLPNGQTRDVLLGITRLPRDRTGELGDYLLNMVDISERKRLERLRERMLANVSHELRTPIAVIRGYAELLQDMGETVDPTFMREALNSIVQRADELLFMIELYLDMANLESGEYILRPEIVSVRSVIDHVWRTLTRGFTSPQLSVNVDPSAEYAWVDAHLFQKIVHHLLSNAVKFTAPEGAVFVRVTSVEGRLRLEVADEGSGIPPSDLPYIFEKFFRGQNAGYGISGVGIGLAFVKIAVEYMGGTIRVKSSAQGTTFTVEIPGASAG